jgi:hypothetical protein
MTVRTSYGLPSTVRTLDPAGYGLPALPSLGLSLLRASSAAAAPVEQLAAIVVDAVRGHAGIEASGIAA